MSRATPRAKTCCNSCGTSIFADKWEIEDDAARCGLCTCYVDGVITEQEALETIKTEKNLSLKRAREARAHWLKHSGVSINHPTGYVSKEN